MSDLREFGFKEHPFPLMPEAEVRNWAGREEERRILLDIVRSVLTTDTGLSEFVVVHGSFGAGKSHALRYLKTMINTDRQAEFGARAIYLPKLRMKPKVSFLDLYFEVVRELGRTFFRDLAHDVCHRLDAAEEQVGDEMDREEERRIRKAEPEKLTARVLESIPAEDRPMVELMKKLGGGDESVLSYLFNGRPIIGEVGFTQEIGSDYVAVKVLASLIRTMTLSIMGQESPFRGAHLFIDEAEDVLELRPPEQDALWTSMRELLNRLPYNFCLLLAFSADAALLEAVIPVSIMERMSRQTIEFQSLRVDEAKEFVRSHMAQFRLPEFEAPQEFYPFNEEAIDYVLETVVIMVPRKIFRALRAVLERAIRRQGLSPGQEVDAKQAEEILLEMRL